MVNTGQELSGKVEIETVAGPQSQRQEAMGRGQQQDGKAYKQENDAWGLAERLHGVNNPPLARVWSNHRLPESDNGAQMAAVTPAAANRSGCCTQYRRR